MSKSFINNHNHINNHAPSSDDLPPEGDAQAIANGNRLLEQMICGAMGPLSRLTQTIDMTLDEVSDWIAQPHNRQQIANLVTLLDAQTQLVICQHRLVAVARLAEVAATATSPETVRRACADLLRIRLVNPYQEDKRPVKMAPPPRISEEFIRQQLERIGQDPLELLANDSGPEPLIQFGANSPKRDSFGDSSATVIQRPSVNLGCENPNWRAQTNTKFNQAARADRDGKSRSMFDEPHEHG